MAEEEDDAKTKAKKKPQTIFQIFRERKDQYNDRNYRKQSSNTDAQQAGGPKESTRPQETETFAKLSNKNGDDNKHCICVLQPKDNGQKHVYIKI